MDLRLFFLLIVFLTFNSLFAKEPYSIVIVGAGPAGLATAIEAKLAKADVTIIENKANYTRPQFVILFENSLNQLDKWNVNLPELAIGQMGDERIGLIQIKYLEQGLAKRVNELGITRILGGFKDIDKGHIIVSNQQGIRLIAYDLLVGADGTHSSVRNCLNIKTKLYGYSLASIAFIPKKNETLNLIFPQRIGSLFINKLLVPTGTILCAQGPSLSKEVLASLAYQMRWEEESHAILSNQASYLDKIEVWLQQAKKFSNYKHAAILVGDAAASASFLQGMGANHAIKTACIAGQFFRSELNHFDYELFNSLMEQTTNKLIQDSLYLFD